jgi:hypothetical protein
MSVGYVGGELVLSCDLPGFPSGCFVAGKPSQAIRHSSTYGGVWWGSPDSTFAQAFCAVLVQITTQLHVCTIVLRAGVHSAHLI